MLEVDRQVSLDFYQRLQKVVPILEIKVFGSRARGDATNESDLDVFISGIDDYIKVKFYS
jgi:predicted nucleotidyltransferase